MKKQILLPFVLLGSLGMVAALAGCTPSGEKGYNVEITNKDALQETWYAGSSRDIDIKLTPAGNVMAELTTGALKIESSNPSVVSITGAVANAREEGSAKVTVKYHGWKDTVDLTIDHKQTIQEKYGVAHAGTSADPLTNEEAIAITNHEAYADGQEDLYVGGTVASFYHAPGSRTDGAVSWFLEPAEEDGAKFEIYKCYKEGTGAASYLTNQDVWKGGYAVAHGRFTKYGEQCETSSAIFDRCEGEPPVDPVTIQATFAEALTAGKALDDGDSTYDYYQFDGYVTKKSGTNYFLTATQGEAITDEKANTIEIYNAATSLDAKLKKNAKVTVKMILKNYHGQVENGVALADADVTVLTEGGSWEIVPEPAVETRTLAQFIAGENTKAKAYNVTAQIKAFKDGSTKDQFGNMTLTDGTNDLIVYGSTATATALAWNDADAYVFTNPKDFLTNTTTSALAIGNTVTVKMIRADYKGTVQGNAIITNVEGQGGGGGGQEVPEPAVATKTLAEFKAVANSKALAYNVTAEVKTCAGDQYGNMTLTDGTNDLTIYGSTATASALVWNKADAYTFTNPKDFNTNTTTKDIKSGDTVTMKLIRSDYNGAIQGQGVITNVVPGAGEESYPVVEAQLQLAASYDLSSYAGASYTQNDGKTAGLTEANALAIFNGGESSVTVSGTNCVTSVTGSKYYQAITNQGCGTGLKLGTKDTEGYVILTCNKNIGKIAITVKAWSATKLATVKINDQASTTLVAADFETAREISLVLENTTKQVKISSSIYSNIQSIALYEMPVAGEGSVPPEWPDTID